MRDLTRIVQEFHQDVIDAVCEHRGGVEMPKNTGLLMIIGYRSSRQYPRFRGPADRHPTPYSNNHTDGLKCKIVYSNHERRYRVKDRYIWAFEPEAKFSKAVSRAFAAGYTRFTFSPDKPGFAQKVDMWKEQEQEEKLNRFLETYNEFSI